ncbi:DUF1796 family putative cysteine peptidase [Alkalihalobacillus sp. AL-G]|uniref:DUF1796 family putative cysteine peptidase n=1 Tax=Alkalihalobacillus sp. AL-G TaxID=2926399 RepID=UPI002729A533|nr:DUF1796 family putative cysteine peptidase [Alkalihalobacillus sp. AL-G]WLD94277.1 papain-like cysteine peptidase [Alkalihalobacillus sp. AL-G]
MRFSQIKKTYSAIISLGNSCTPAAQLRRHKLRTFSAPFDWVVSHSLSDICNLFSKRFKDYMKFQNLQVIKGSSVYVDNEIVQPVKSYFIKDCLYNIISVHDFPVLPNQHWSHNYTAVKVKVNRRVNRLLYVLENSDSLLFIRWKATQKEALELRSVLSQLTKGEIHILVLNPVNNIDKINLLDWGLENICALKVPNQPENDQWWDHIFSGITLKA